MCALQWTLPPSMMLNKMNFKTIQLELMIPKTRATIKCVCKSARLSQVQVSKSTRISQVPIARLSQVKCQNESPASAKFTAPRKGAQVRNSNFR